jgi:hypothetical protein
MKITRKLRLALFVPILLCASPIALGGKLDGVWVLQVQDPKHQEVATLKVQLTDNRADDSCMSGNWKVVHVLSKTTKIKDFFPVNAPLAYQVENGYITIGRTALCDRYLLLEGPLGGGTVEGKYFSYSFGNSSSLGYFRLRRTQ